MTYPTPEQLASWAANLSATDWTKLARRLGHAIERDRRGGSAIPDGYPNGSGGSGGVSELTAVEAAVHARTTARDEHHDRTVNAVGYLEQAVMSLAALVSQLDRIEARVYVDRTADDIWCSHHLAHGMTEPRHKGDLCDFCLSYKATTTKLPSALVMTRRHETGRVPKEEAS